MLPSGQSSLIQSRWGSQLTQEEDLMDDTYVDEMAVPSEDEEA
jgi:hypothetical protein